jgi:hypothetical protein
MQAGLGGELLEIDRGGLAGQCIEQAHHALDDLDRRLGCFLGHGRAIRVWRAILYAEIGRDNPKTAVSRGNLAPGDRYSG